MFVVSALDYKLQLIINFWNIVQKFMKIKKIMIDFQHLRQGLKIKTMFYVLCF